MLVLTAPNQAEIVVKKSRFIADIQSVSGLENAKETLKAMKAAWAEKGITHLVHAFIVGPGQNVVSCSDDGEPSGTAGRPVLEVLKGSHLTNVLLTVARYFGGIKLGTGGLVKAYGDSAKAVLADVQSTELVPMRDFTITAPYSLHERLKLIFRQYEATIATETFDNGVTLTGTMRAAVFDEIAVQCRDLSRGKALLQSPQEEEDGDTPQEVNLD